MNRTEGSLNTSVHSKGISKIIQKKTVGSKYIVGLDFSPVLNVTFDYDYTR